MKSEQRAEQENGEWLPSWCRHTGLLGCPSLVGDRQRTLPTYKTVGFRKRSTADRGGVVQNPPVLREGQEILLGPGIPSKYQHKAEV